MDTQTLTLVLIAMIAAGGSSVGGVMAAIVTTRATRKAQEAATISAQRAQEAAVEAQLATVRAQADAARAQAQAAEAASALVRAAREQGRQLDNIERTGAEVHTLVNAQRTSTLRILAALARRVANENPEDIGAQKTAELAERDAADATRGLPA